MGEPTPHFIPYPIPNSQGAVTEYLIGYVIVSISSNPDPIDPQVIGSSINHTTV